MAFAPYCDLLWMETKSPIYEQAKEFADGVHAVYPDKWLAYNVGFGRAPFCDSLD